ncbi:MAG TPA: transporter [Steroidobacteraceae bacterium]|nr:transporter [Steroidobacteraceae bacterium]
MDGPAARAAHRDRRRHALAAAALLAGTSLPGAAQELEPRAYSPNPVGVTFVLGSYNRSTGDVLFDPSLPFSDVEAQLNAGAFGLGRTFGLFGRSATAAIALPYVWGDISGNVNEEASAITRSGPADTRLRLSVNLIGGPALTPAEFMRREPRTTLGASLTVIAPSGEYDPAKLINIGSNRWSFKPEFGLSVPWRRWFFDAYAGVWLFTDNGDFFGGNERAQDPIYSIQLHASYTFRPSLWIALDSTWYEGGRTELNGVHNDDEQSNVRIGLTLSVPLIRQHSLKLSWSDGATTRVGGDFVTYGIAWQYTFVSGEH